MESELTVVVMFMLLVIHRGVYPVIAIREVVMLLLLALIVMGTY